MTRAAELPPHDVAAEEAVLAALLLDGAAFALIAGTLREEDFFREHHGWVWKAAAALYDRGEIITLPTIAYELDRMKMLDAVGAEPFLAELCGRYFTAVGIEAHAQIVARTAFYRQLISHAQWLAQTAHNAPTDPQRVIGVARDSFDSIVGAYGERLAGQRRPAALYDSLGYTGELSRL